MRLKTVAISGGIICLILALWAAIWFWAAILTVRPAQVISKWEQETLEVDQALASKMQARLEQSIYWNAKEANTHLLLARLYEQLASTQTDKQQFFSQLAEQEYKLAIHHQPTWAYAWAKLANFYSNQEDVNKVTQALAQAITLGPYEELTQKLVIPLIFKYWHALQAIPVMQEQIINILKHALKYYKNERLTLSSAKTYNKLAELEPLVVKRWHKNRLNKYKKELAKEQTSFSKSASKKENND